VDSVFKTQICILNTLNSAANAAHAPHLMESDLLLICRRLGAETFPPVLTNCSFFPAAGARTAMPRG
jgi:hypothetical protein